MKMGMLQILSAVLCVVTVSVGQMLFKWAGLQIQKEVNWLSWKVMVPVGIALIIYGISTLLWINVLRQIALNKAYLFAALSFILVPFCAYIIFHEPVSFHYVLGTLLIIIGIIIAIHV